MKSFDQDMERLMVTLINEIVEYVNELFVIILDDFHLLENIPSITLRRYRLEKKKISPNHFIRNSSHDQFSSIFQVHK